MLRAVAPDLHRVGHAIDSVVVRAAGELQQLAHDLVGSAPGGPPDFNGDGTVGITDFLELLANWGPCPMG